MKMSDKKTLLSFILPLEHQYTQRKTAKSSEEFCWGDKGINQSPSITKTLGLTSDPNWTKRLSYHRDNRLILLESPH